MNDMILILNYSDEFAVEAARRLRGEQVFCKIISGMTTAAQIAQAAPRGIVLCGEPQSAAGVFDAEILKLGLPVLRWAMAAHMLITAMGRPHARARPFRTGKRLFSTRSVGCFQAWRPENAIFRKP